MFCANLAMQFSVSRNIRKSPPHRFAVCTRHCRAAESRRFCDGYFRQKTEYETAQAAARFEERACRVARRPYGGRGEHRGGCRSAIADHRRDPVPARGCSQAGVDDPAGCECGSGFGFMVVLAMWNEPTRERERPSGQEGRGVPEPVALMPLSSHSFLLPSPSSVPALSSGSIAPIAAWSKARLIECQKDGCSLQRSMPITFNGPRPVAIRDVYLDRLCPMV